jgi:hypothetical protein
LAATRPRFQQGDAEKGPIRTDPVQGAGIGRIFRTWQTKEDEMTYHEDRYTPTGTQGHYDGHPVGQHAPTGGSGWGLAVALVLLLGLLGLAMMAGTADERGTDGASAPATAPMTGTEAPATPAPLD